MHRQAPRSSKERHISDNRSALIALLARKRRLKEIGAKWPSGFTFQVIAVRPHSRGSVTIRSDSPYDAPVIDTGFLRDERDLETLKAGMKKVRPSSSPLDASDSALVNPSQCPLAIPWWSLSGVQR